MDLRSTQRQENTDAANPDVADTYSLSREVAEADLWSARRQTNTEFDSSEQCARDLPKEDRQSARRQQSTEFENDDLTTQDSLRD